MTYTPKQLATLRRRAKLTQPSLASDLGVHVQTVKNWEAGRRGISPRYHAQLEELLGTASAVKPSPNSRPKYTDLAPGDWAAASKYGWCELKYDGHYAEIRGGPNGWAATDRRGSLIASGSRPMPVCHMLCDHIDGTEWARKSVFYGRYIAWAALSSKGVHLGRGELNEATGAALHVDLGIQASLRFPLADAPRVWDLYVIDDDWEGLIFRTAGGRFARMKKRVTMDYVCTGSTGGSVTGALYNKQGKLIDKVRVPCPDEPRLGQVFEASGLAVTERGSLRNPRWERWRDDKPARECTR